MKSIRLLALFTLAGLVAPLHAQSEADIPIEYRVDRKNSFSMGVRIIGGADVKFGNLGTVPSTLTAIPALSAGTVFRQYHDGSVDVDAARDSEKDGDLVITTPGGRYPTTSIRLDVDGNQILDENGNAVTQVSGDYLAYTPGLTRNWSYSTELQNSSNPGFVAFHEYSSIASGGGISASSSAGPGFELAGSHRFGKLGSSKIEWGVLFSGGLTDINGKTSGNVRASLITRTDLYSLRGNIAPASPYSSPSFDSFTGADGTVYESSHETTVPLAEAPSSSATTTAANAADVSGHWQIKGAYYMFRVGPSIRIPVGERFALSASAGYAGAYVGTKYKVEETLNVASGVPGLTFTGEETYSKFLSGAYAEANFEWWLTTRTGFFVGASFEKLGKYSQTIGLRTADVDIGGNAGFRFGISTKF